jgi:hypothetical protein
MKLIGWIPAFQVLLLVAFPSAQVIADGGIMRLSQAQGPFLVTIFSTPELVPHRPVDVSLLVQRRDSKDMVLDATVDLHLIPSQLSSVEPGDPMCGSSPVGRLRQASGEHSAGVSIRATRGQSSNKLLYAAAVEFDTPGNWTLDATVEAMGEPARVSCRVSVEPAARQLAGLLPYLFLPAAAVLIFAVNQYLR